MPRRARVNLEHGRCFSTAAEPCYGAHVAVTKRKAVPRAAKKTPASLAVDIVADARMVIEVEGRAVLGLAERLNGDFTRAVERILACSGRVVVTGLGKSGIVGQKISATLASTGTPSLFLHAAEALHGDLGRITRDDVVLAMSNSGESEEVVRLIKPIKSLGATLVGMTAVESSTLARHADIALTIGQVAEAGNLGLVPTASTTAMMVLGDALAVCLFHCRGFGREEYARFHPGGELGRKLMTVREVMRGGSENPVIGAAASVRDALQIMSETPGRPGAVSVVGAGGKLAGFFTDGDVRRLLVRGEFDATASIGSVMHKEPKRITADALVAEAVRILRENKIDQVPVVDGRGAPVGLFDVQDLLSTRDV
jgi:arabinose-5-phosphate isomerase